MKTVEKFEPFGWMKFELKISSLEDLENEMHQTTLVDVVFPCKLINRWYRD